MGNQVQGAMKTMNNIIGITGGDGRSGSDREPLERLPEGERYFGFVNVRIKYAF